MKSRYEIEIDFDNKTVSIPDGTGVKVIGDNKLLSRKRGCIVFLESESEIKYINTAWSGWE